MALPLVFADATTQNRCHSVFWLSKRPEKWPFRWFLRTLRHEIGPTAYSGCRSVRGNGPSAGFCRRYDMKSGLQRILAVQASTKMASTTVFADTTTQNRPYSCSGCPSVRGNGHSIGFCGRYDTKSGLQRILAVQASGEMALPSVFPDATTRNQAYSVFWLSKRPGKWPFRWFLRTLRHEIGPTAYSGCPSVHENGPSAVFCGHYDTESALQHVLAVQASGEMALPLVFADATTRNQAYSVFWLSKRPEKWPFRCFSRTLRHETEPTGYSGGPSVRRKRVGPALGNCRPRSPFNKSL